MRVIPSAPKNLRTASADACDVLETVNFDGEEFTFAGYTVYEDNRGNAEWSYYYSSATRFAVGSGAYTWSVTA